MRLILSERYEKNVGFCNFAANSIAMTLDICPSPALYPFYKKENDTVIVVDILRASTTICAMLNNGAAAVIPVASTDEARHYKSLGFLVGGERNARKCDFADFGNSPFDYTPEIVSGKEVVFTTTNGTQAIEAANDSQALYIGAFSNIDALVEKCSDVSGRIVVLCAGWNNRVNMEDTLFGGAFAKKLLKRTNVSIASDYVKMALDLWQLAKNNPLEYVKKAEHYQRLKSNNAETEVEFCLRENTMEVVPWYDRKEKKLKK